MRGHTAAVAALPHVAVGEPASRPARQRSGIPCACGSRDPSVARSSGPVNRDRLPQSRCSTSHPRPFVDAATISPGLLADPVAARPRSRSNRPRAPLARVMSRSSATGLQSPHTGSSPTAAGGDRCPTSSPATPSPTTASRCRASSPSARRTGRSEPPRQASVSPPRRPAWPTPRGVRCAKRPRYVSNRRTAAAETGRPIGFPGALSRTAADTPLSLDLPRFFDGFAAPPSR